MEFRLITCVCMACAVLLMIHGVDAVVDDQVTSRGSKTNKHRHGHGQGGRKGHRDRNVGQTGGQRSVITWADSFDTFNRDGDDGIIDLLTDSEPHTGGNHENRINKNHSVIVDGNPDGNEVPVDTLTEAPPVVEYWYDGPQLYERPPGGEGCMYNKYYYSLMQLFMLGDGCNTCVCTEYNQMVCTLLDCGFNAGCNFHGEPYDIYAHWPLGIGCQWCYCHLDGYILCDLDQC